MPSDRMPPSNRIFTGTLAIAALTLSGLLHAAGDEQAEPITSVPPSTHHVLDGQASRGTELAVLTPPDGLTIAPDGPSVDVPWIISPFVRGRGGVQWLQTVVDQPQYLVRLGVGWADVQPTGRAAPFQIPPGRGWNLDGTVLAGRFDGGEVYASWQRRNWGPGWTGSLILDGAAPPVAAVGLRRPVSTPSDNPWLQWMGPWSADVFFGRLFGHDAPVRPALIGMRLLIQPFSNFEFGLSRTMQWGGRGREEDFKTLLRALVGWDNAGSHGVTVENQPGNQLAGFDWRLQLGADRGDAFYGQMIGEDEDHGLPTAYIFQAGLQTRWTVRDAVLLGFVEYNDLIASHAYHGDRPPGITYTSSVFKRGYTQDGMPLGYPAGGDVTLASVGLLAQIAAVQMALVLSHGNALPTSQRFSAGPISGFNGSLQLNIDSRHQLGAALWWWRDTAQRQRALQLWLRFLL